MFEDAYRSRLSCVVLDNLERLIEWVDVGMRFNNVVFQTISVLLGKIPKKAENRLMIIGTTSNAAQLEHLSLPQSFQLRVSVPDLEEEELRDLFVQQGLKKDMALALAKMMGRGPVKKALAVLDMVGEEQDQSKFREVLDSFALSSWASSS